MMHRIKIDAVQKCRNYQISVPKTLFEKSIHDLKCAWWTPLNTSKDAHYIFVHLMLLILLSVHHHLSITGNSLLGLSLGTFYMKKYYRRGFRLADAIKGIVKIW